MKNVFLVTDPATLTISANQSATADIRLQIDGIHFPDPHWNDFAVVILGWWALALSRLTRGESTTEQLYFMDGPYFVQVALASNGNLQFQAFRRGLEEPEARATGEEPMIQFVRQLVSQSRQFLKMCKQQRWWSEDAEVLKSSIAALGRDAKRLK